MKIEGQYRRLQRRLMVAMLAFSLAPLMALTLYFAHQYTSSFEAKIQADLRRLTESKLVGIDLFLRERINQVHNLAMTVGLTQLTNKEKLAEVFTTIDATTRSFQDLGVIDEQGNHLAYVGPFHLESANYKNSPWFREVMEKGIYLSDVFLGVRGVPHNIIAVARQEGGRTLILRAGIDTTMLSALLADPQVKHNAGDVFLVSRDDVLQTDSSTQGKALDTVRTPLPPLGERGVYLGGYSTGGHHWLYGTAWLTVAPWALMVYENARNVQAPLYYALAQGAGFLVVGLCVIVAGAWLTSRHIVLRIMRSDSLKAQADAEALQSNKMAALGKLAASVAHEINNPLMLIRENAGWMLDLLQDHDIERKELVRSAEKIEAHVDRAKGVTKRLLSFGRSMPAEKQSVSLNTLADETIEFLAAEAANRSIVFERLYDAALPVVVTDAAQLQQVILNILDNAIDAIGQDGTVCLISSAQAETCTLCICDSGTGVPEDLRQKIFDPFVTTKPLGEGTGLGLAVCYSIMERLGGRLLLDNGPPEMDSSVPPERGRVCTGACFTIVLSREAHDTGDAL